jgi:hypothetical protein
MPRAPFTRALALFALAAGLGLAVAGPPAAAAAPALAHQEARGEGLAETLRAGQTTCRELSAADLELIGEYAMGRHLGGEAIHAAMDRRMTRMIGETGERRMHVALGYRYSGCPGGPASEWVGPMAGMMRGFGAGAHNPGMMNVAETGERGSSSGTMMGSGGHGGDLSTLGIVLVALASAALGAAAATLLPPFGRHSRRR